jgi:hypothetical protein
MNQYEARSRIREFGRRSGDPVADVIRQATLGVDGNTPQDQADRLDRATAISADAAQVSEAAYLYAAAHALGEPHLPDMSIAHAIQEARGDVTKIDPSLIRDAVEDAAGARPRTEFIRDEDGERYEYYDPSEADPDLRARVTRDQETVLHRLGVPEVVDIAPDASQVRLPRGIDAWQASSTAPATPEPAWESVPPPPQTRRPIATSGRLRAPGMPSPYF